MNQNKRLKSMNKIESIDPQVLAQPAKCQNCKNGCHDRGSNPGTSTVNL